MRTENRIIEGPVVANKGVARACFACLALEVDAVARGLSADLQITTCWVPGRPMREEIKKNSHKAVVLWRLSADGGFPVTLRAQGPHAEEAFDAMRRVFTAPSYHCNSTEYAQKVFRGEVPLPPNTDVSTAQEKSSAISQEIK